MTQTILITGAKGFVGTYLRAALADHAPAANVVSLVAPGQGEPGFVVADLLDRDAIDAAMATARPDVVIHLAAQASVARTRGGRRRRHLRDEPRRLSSSRSGHRPPRARDTSSLRQHVGSLRRELLGRRSHRNHDAAATQQLREVEAVGGVHVRCRPPDLLAHVDPVLLEGEDGTIQVNVSTTRLSELNDGVDALLHYPYGCVEQTTSSLMPWLALKDFRDVLPQLRRTPEQVDNAVAHGVDRLIGMQTEGGGLAYWPDVTGRDPSPWGSALRWVGPRAGEARRVTSCRRPASTSCATT